ncbi:hypothetical protein B0H11DRAFT_2343124 [Mycena galericulata]|nr:hypothetical protein B0H11DRAFT_2343124 [Mycena galericulata]
MAKGEVDNSTVSRKKRGRRGEESDDSPAPIAGPSSLAVPLQLVSEPDPKRRRRLLVDPVSQEVLNASTQLPAQPPIIESLRLPMDTSPEPVKSGASVAMNKAKPHLVDAQRDILASFTHKFLGNPCSCGAVGSETIYRCRDCFKARMCCSICIIHKHEDNPFHRIEKWEGRFFSPSSLEKLGQVVQTCLDVEVATGRCPHVTDKTVGHKMTLGDHNGFHDVKFEFCSCSPGRGLAILPVWRQLLAVRLFPASFASPATVFTWRTMKEFHIHCLASKKSAYDYIKALCKLTDNAFVHAVKDRYREFQFAYRIWRYLALERRTGQAHGIDQYVPHRRPGSLTLRCPACPEVGFNISVEEMNAALDTEKQFTLYLSVDGNFKLQRKNKRDDPDDVALNDGRGYFVETEAYKQYLSVVKPTEDPATCSHLRAARMQNMAKFKNAVITGVVAVQCARHGFYLPQAMVDLKKGEAFANTDYAIAHGLAEATLQRFIMITYDIWCQFSIHLKDRFADYFPSMLPIIEKIRGAIPKMHIHNHIELCQLIWNLNWLMYSAFTVGEMIETGWAEHNLTAGSTKEQNDGNRHDSVDDTSGNWNWDKMVGIAATLQRLYRVCQSELRSRKTNFENVTAMHPKERVAKWEAMDITPKKLNGNGRACFKLTSRKAYAKILKDELEADGTGDHKTGDSALITSGLLLERDQHHVRRMIAQHVGSDLVDAGRQRLFAGITDLRTRLVARVPALAAHMVEVDTEKPEKELIFLPSHFTEITRSEVKMEALAQVEYGLREGQAFDALAEVRTAIQTLNFNLEIKKTQIHGTGSNTKGQNFLKVLSNDIQFPADTYRRARKALIALGMNESDASLRELHRSDLFGKSGRSAHMGDSKKPDSWVWTTGRAANLTDEEEREWEAEMERVRWFRDRALRDRAVEEAETLEKEFERAIRWFKNTSEVWEKLGGNATENGAKAYAYKQATMFAKLGWECEEKYAEAPALAEKDRIAEEKKAQAKAVEEQRVVEEKMAAEGLDEFAAYYETVEI